MVQLVGLFSFVNILNSTAAQIIYTLPASFALPDTIYYNIVFIYFLFKYESEEKKWYSQCLEKLAVCNIKQECLETGKRV